MTPGQIVIFGRVFSDDNHIGVMDGAEAPLAGVNVYLDANQNRKLDRNELSTTTNAQGGYSFYHLAAGTYTVREIVPFGDSLTTPTAFNVILGIWLEQYRRGGQFFGLRQRVGAGWSGQRYLHLQR